jgi:hypothetical protein
MTPEEHTMLIKTANFELEILRKQGHVLWLAAFLRIGRRE